MSESRKLDYTLILAVALLVLIGLMMLHSAGMHLFALAPDIYGSPERFFLQQLRAVALGVILATAIQFVNRDQLKAATVPLLAGVILLLFAVQVGGGGRWLITSRAGRSLQPSEFARIILIIYAAYWLSAKQRNLASLTRGFIPFGVIVGVVTGLVILQMDLSMAWLIAVTAVVMFFIAGADVLLWVTSLLAGTFAAFLVLKIGLFSHAQHRLELWQALREFINGFRVPSEITAEQPFWALQAIVSGGIMGKGLGQATISPLMMDTLPSDGMIALVSEELGLLGALAVITLLGIVVYRGFEIARRSRDLPCKLMAAGISWTLALQALIHVASMSGIMPVTGMTYPFLSLGGSSMLGCMLGVGLLLRLNAWALEDEGGKVQNARYDYRRGHRRPRLSRPRRSRVPGK